MLELVRLQAVWLRQAESLGDIFIKKADNFEHVLENLAPEGGFDLLAAVPSIIYGVWGLFVLAPRLRPVAMWLNTHFGGVFLFAT